MTGRRLKNGFGLTSKYQCELISTSIATTVTTTMTTAKSKLAALNAQLNEIEARYNALSGNLEGINQRAKALREGTGDTLVTINQVLTAIRAQEQLAKDLEAVEQGLDGITD